MKPFVRIKKISGIEYLYEVTPYKDPETGKVRQKTKYLGKNVNGVPVKVRSQGQPPKTVLSYGEFLPFNKIIADLKLDTILSEVLPEHHIWPLLTLAMNYAIRPRALYHIQSWYEGTVLNEDHPNLSLSSQSLSNLLSSIGNSAIHLGFSNRLIHQVSTSSTLFYDITSISSYSETINLLEYGYNRDGLDLPQLNLALIVDKQLGIPVMYDIYPGSIVDVSTLMNTTKKINSMGVRDYTLIMDRGLFSTANIYELVENDLSFIIPPTSTLKNVKEAISAIHSSIDDPNNLKLYQNEPLFVKPITIEVGEISLQGYAYYDQKREQQERTTFYKRLYDLSERLKSVVIKPQFDPAVVFREIAKRDARYFEWSLNGNKFEISIRQNAVSQRVNKMGKFILLYRGNQTWDDCLSLYRSRDLVEKAFDVLKNDIDVMPVNVRTDSSLRGYLFACFISLIMRMKLMRMMKDSELLSKYSVEAVLLELEKIRLMILPDGQKVMTELTKRQREILGALGVCA